jgi:hypothetical protein
MSAIAIVGAPVLGALVASRRPANAYGWLWLGFGLGLALSVLAQAYAAYALVAEPGSLPAPKTVGTAVAAAGWVVALALMPLLLLLFPNGRTPSPRWRFVVWAVVVAAAVMLIAGPFVPGSSGFAPIDNPLGVGGAVGEVMTILLVVGVPVIFVAVVLSALSLVLRYRRAGGVERQQIKWFAFAAVLFGAPLTIDLLGYHDMLGDALWRLLDAATLVGLYVAVGVAILRHRLYDIDVIINRTLVYGSLTALLALVYLGGVAMTQTIFRLLSDQGEQPQLAVVVSTLVIAALFAPLRRRIQYFIDRRFYRRKYDARKTLAAFNSRLREETDIDALSKDVVGVASRTVQPEHVSLWLRPDPRPEARGAAFTQSGQNK